MSVYEKWDTFKCFLIYYLKYNQCKRDNYIISFILFYRLLNSLVNKNCSKFIKELHVLRLKYEWLIYYFCLIKVWSMILYYEGQYITGSNYLKCFKLIFSFTNVTKLLWSCTLFYYFFIILQSYFYYNLTKHYTILSWAMDEYYFLVVVSKYLGLFVSLW